MRNILKKSLFIALGCMLSTVVWGATIYSSDFIANPTGAATSIDKGEFIGAPSWATGYSNCFHTTGSAGAVTITFTPPVDLSSYTNCKLKLIWGATSNRPVNLSVNNGSATQIDAVTTSADRSKVRTVEVDISVTSITSLKFAGSGGKDSYYFHFEITEDQAGPSSDATLKSLKYNNVSVPSFSPSTYTYNVELPAGTTTVPTVTAEKNDTKASTPVITPATSLPGATTVVVTAEDGTTSLTYTINFTVASSYPKVLTATWANIAGTATIDEVNKTITGKVAQGTGLTAITPTFTGNNFSANSWTPQGAQDFSNGAVNYTFTNSTTSELTTYAVTITEVPVVHPTSVSLDKTQLNLQVGANATLTPTVLPTDVTDPSVSWSSNNTAVATVSNGTVTGVTAGTATITVTTVDGQKTATCSVTVTDAPPVPYTTLTLHEPEVYEANPKDGGYGANLTVFANREYEVYYGSYDESSNLSITVTPTRKIDGITTSKSSTSFEAKDGWFKGVASGGKSDYSFINNDEFKAGGGAIHKLANGNEYLFHIKGYDQFSIMGTDNNANASKNRHLEVYVDDNLQPMTLSTNVTIRRFDISTSEHVIKVKAIHDGDSKSELYAFSLRVAQVPFTKHLKGNDSTQVILQTTAMRPITYYTKYNSFGETLLEWDGQEATGISLQPRGQGAVGDTLVVTGTANCPTGVYNFHINTYFNNTLTGSLPGKITVQSDIKALTETYAEGYQGMSIDDINFSYHALSADDITLSWKNDNAPGGINGSGSEGIYSISGTPTSTGTFIYTVTVLGGNSITDTLVVKASDIPANAVLYLYKNTKAYEKDGVYQYMTGSRNLFPLKATSAGKRSQTEYNKFKWILISQDVDANNPEIIQLIQSRTGLPILNLNGFTYGKDEKRLGWGDPNNGAVDADKNRQGCSITIEQSGHPIFSKMSSPTDGKTVKIVDQYAKNGVMPIDVNNMPSDIASLCLATAHTRGEGYYEEGPLQTAIHEIPPVQGHSKYICLPLAREVTLTAEGKKLIDGIIDYLLSPASTTIKAPTLQMNSFAVAGHSATIDQTNDLIVLSLTEKEYLDADSLAAVTPVITVDNPKTHVVPGADEVLDLRFANYITKTFVVTDYVNRRPYTLQLTITKPQGIDEVYTAGQWVNIFDIYGRKVATTNEDVYTMVLPHGMYIVVTENGGTLKIMR